MAEVSQNVPIQRQPIPHQYTLQYWFCLFETPELGRHLIRATGVRDKATVEAHIKQMHPNMHIIDLHPLRDHQELVDAAAKLTADPNWMPLTNEGLRDSANAVAEQQTPQIPSEVLNNPTARPIVDAAGRPVVPAGPQEGQQAAPQPQTIPIHQ